VIVHLIYLHETLSRNPIGLKISIDTCRFHPFFSSKDFFGILIAFVLILFFRFFSPVFFVDAENFIPANPIVTPTHIKPE